MAEAERRDIERRMREVGTAFAEGDLATLADVYAEDAALLPADGPVRTGRPAIRRYWEGVRGAGVLRVALRTDELEADDRMAVGVGTVEVVAAGGVSAVPWKYVTVWARDPGGPWRVSQEIRNHRRLGEPNRPWPGL